MTRYFNYTFKYYLDYITISKQVTDNMEERDAHKRIYAIYYFNDFLRQYAGYKRSYATCASAGFKEVTRKETVSKKQTLENMEKAKIHFRTELENGNIKA